MPDFISRRIHHGANVLRSWLRAIGVPVERRPGGVVVAGQVAEVLADPDTLLSDGSLGIVADFACSADRDTALAAFHVLTEEFGHGRPIPVDRGASPTTVEIYDSDFFLVNARHREFRHAPDLPPSERTRYQGVVRGWTRSFCWSNRSLLGVYGYDISDMETYAWVWTTIFAHRSEITATTPESKDSERLLVAYLRQRGYEFSMNLRRKAACLVGPEEDNANLIALEAHPDDVPFDARAKLMERLGQMSHGDMVAALTAQTTNPAIGHIARRKAKGLLRQHFAKCTECVSNEDVSQGGDEQVGHRDGLSSLEPLEDAGE